MTDQFASPQTAELISLQLRTLHTDVTDMRRSLTEMTRALTQLALIEDRQLTANKAMERAFTTLQNIEARVSALEKKVPETERTVGWVDKALLALSGAAFMYVIKSTGLLP
jgi:hypothetical protein